MKDFFGSEYIPPDKGGRVRHSADQAVAIARLPLRLTGPGPNLCVMCNWHCSHGLWLPTWKKPQPYRQDGFWLERDGCGWTGHAVKREWSGAPFLCLDCALWLCEILWAESPVAWSPDYIYVAGREVEPLLNRILRECCPCCQRGAI